MDIKLVKASSNIVRNLRRRTIIITLAVIMGINAVISAFVLLAQSLRLDESQSLWQTSHSFTGMLRVVAEDVHVPLYHTVLHFWIQAFGDTAVAARSLSLVLFMITIPMVYKLARLMLSDRQALVAAALAGLSPFMIWYGNEARMYSLLALLTVLSQYFFIRILQRRSGYNWTWYTLAAVAGAYTHYFFMVVLLTQGLYYIMQHRQFAPGSFKRLIAVALTVLASLAPWLIYVRSLGSASGDRPLLVQPSSVDFFNTFSQFVFGFQPDSINSVIVSFWPLTVLFAFLAIGKNKRFPREIQFMALAAILPVVLAFAVSYLVTPIFVSRYLIIALPALYIFLAWLVTNYARKVMLVVGGTLVLAIAITSVHQNVSAATPVKEEYRAVATTISAKATPSDTVIVSTPFTKYPFDYYYTGVAQVTTLPGWVKGPMPGFDPAKLPAEVDRLATDHEYAYLVQSYDQGYEKQIKAYFDMHFQKVSEQTFSKGLTLSVYRVGYRTTPLY